MRRDGARGGLPALAALARPQPGERARLGLSIALAAGAAGAAIALLATSGYLISRAAERPQILALMVAIVAVRGFGITRAGMRYAERLASHDLALRRLARLRQSFFAALAPRLPGTLTRRSGDLLSRFVADVDTLRDLYPRVVIPGALAALVVAGAALASWLILPAAGAVVLVSLAVSALALPALSTGVGARVARRQAPARARLTSELIEDIDGAIELTLAGRGEERVRSLRTSDRRLVAIARSDSLAAAAAASAGQLLTGLGLVALLVVAIPAVHSGSLSPVLLAALVFLLLGAYESILPLSAAARVARQCATAAARLQEVTSARPEVEDPPHPRTPSGTGDLCLHDVSFRYGPRSWVLEHVELRVAPGERVALMGPSGAGKSTLAELLVRFHDPLEGRVTLDGIDLRELAQADVRGAVVLCAQDSHVFNTSIRENLLLARRDSYEQELRRALAVVELDEWALGLPRGLDTLVGQDGELVSGGQRTRIALARALLARSRFVILDEPTAHLDAALARRVIHNLMDACGERGVLLITHDADVLEGFDRILSA